MQILLTDFSTYYITYSAYYLTCTLVHHGDISHVTTAAKMMFPIQDFFSKCDQIHRKLRIWSHLLNNTLMENFLCSVCTPKKVLYLRWNERHLRAYFETLMTLLQT